ncbi:MAG TPA: hypothetical protein VGQ80_07725, partial [Acidimicrobiia bacterium]|nr:hypothetical protein [Acidimicrobiia bacterium]
MRVVASSLSSDTCAPEHGGIVRYAAPRRRLTTGSHAEFVGALVREFRGSLASLKGASELMTRRSSDLDEAVMADLTAIIDGQAARVAWLVRVLEAVDG